MSSFTWSVRRRRPFGVCLLVAALASAIAVAAGGCGDDDEAAAPKELTIKATGTATKASFSLPKSVPAGVTRIELENAGQGDRTVQFVRVDPGHTFKEAMDAANAWAGEGRSLPAWVHPEGGVAPAAPGATSTATQELVPGRYLITDTDTEAEPTVDATFTVTGEKSDGELPATDARIDASEYAFRAQGLNPGRSTILFENKGREPHFLEAVPIKPGKSIADVRRFLTDEKGEPPVDFDKGVSTPVLDGRAAQVADIDVPKGRYALMCFVPDRKGGPPHAFKGMVSEIVVE